MYLPKELSRLMKKRPIDIFLQLTDEELRIGYRKRDLKVTAFKLFTEVPTEKIKKELSSLLDLDEMKVTEKNNHKDVIFTIDNKEYVARYVYFKVRNGIAETRTWVINIISEKDK